MPESKNQPLRTALVYDFDGTLAPGNIQEHSLLRDYLKMSKEDFWELVKKSKKDSDADEVLVYMRLLLERADELGIPITRDILHGHGANTPLFDGVLDWFKRISEHGSARGLALEHYIISSGNEEMIRGTTIHSHFQQVFASRYHYDKQGRAAWPAVAVNYTTKTQYLFRINKGVDNHWNHASAAFKVGRSST